MACTFQMPPARFRPAAVFIAAHVLAAGAAGAALASCPASIDDARRGILITYADGATVAARLLPDGLQQDTEIYEAGGTEGYFSLGRAVVFLVEDMPISGGVPQLDERMTYTWPVAPDALPAIAPGLLWEGNLVQTGADGARTTLKYRIRGGPLTETTHAGCRFDVIPLTGRSTTPNGHIGLLVYDHVPALGLSFFRGYSETPEPETYPDIVAFGPYPGK